MRQLAESRRCPDQWIRCLAGAHRPVDGVIISSWWRASREPASDPRSRTTLGWLTSQPYVSPQYLPPVGPAISDTVSRSALNPRHSLHPDPARRATELGPSVPVTETGGGTTNTPGALQQSSGLSIAALHRLLIESVSDYAIFVLDKAGHVLSWNPGAERLKGYSAQDIIGTRFDVFYTVEDIGGEKPRRLLEIAQREGRVEDEGWRVRKDGSRFWANVVITALRDPNGQLVGFAKVTRDLTTRREAEEAGRRHAAAEAARREAERRSSELTRLNAQLEAQAVELEAQREEAQELTEEAEQSNEALNEALTIAELMRAKADEANRAKADFLRTMSHELRTPLNAIGGYVQLLEMGIPDRSETSQSGFLERIKRAQRHLQSLVDNVLMFARIEAGQMQYHVETVLVHDLWDGVEPLVAPQIRAKGLGYHIGSLDRTIAVRADREKAVQVLVNLVGNAIKFTSSGGEIWLDTRVRATDVALHVRDSGIGIRAHELAVIFEPFTQGESRAGRDQSGVGLGLAISRQLARAMAGELTVESTPGEGSTFTLTLPIVR